jgi:hypothetical protein
MPERIPPAFESDKADGIVTSDLEIILLKDDREKYLLLGLGVTRSGI